MVAAPGIQDWGASPERYSETKVEKVEIKRNDSKKLVRIFGRLFVKKIEICKKFREMTKKRSSKSLAEKLVWKDFLTWRASKTLCTPLVWNEPGLSRPILKILCFLGCFKKPKKPEKLFFKV